MTKVKKLYLNKMQKKKKKNKAVFIFENKEVSYVGFYEVNIISEKEIEERKVKLLKRLSVFTNIY